MLTLRASRYSFFQGSGFCPTPHARGLSTRARANELFPTTNTVSGEITLVEYVVSLDKLGVHDVEHVGGKNSSLGEMISNLAGAGVSVPGGFATTAQAYRDFLELSGLNDQIHAALDALDVDDVNALARTGAQIR
ncbi:Phosphoenolpyruvate synthase, partial [Pseudomonas cannabina]